MNRRSLLNFIRKDRVFVPEPEPEEDLIDTKHTRRFFFGILAGAAATAVIAPQVDLSGWNVAIETGPALEVGNELILSERMTREFLVALHNNLTIVKDINQHYDGHFRPMKIGDTLNIRRPARFVPQAVIVG